MNTHLWGIDLGGTKMEGVILTSIHDATPLVRIRIDTEADKGYEHIVQQIFKLIGLMRVQSGIRPQKIGIGTPGVLDPVLETMKNCNTTVLNEKPLQKDLEAGMPCDFILANDANCFALAETHWGAVKKGCPDARVVFGIIMGTGVGGGIVVNGKIWNGKHGIAGEWGHNVLVDDGPLCYCGKRGCVETIVSGPATERYYESISGKKLKLKEIVAHYKERNDMAAKETIDRLCLYFGKAASVITNLLDPDVIVVGGGVGNIDALYTEGLASLKKYIFNNRLDVPVLKPGLGDSAGVFGAAALVS